MEKYDIRSLFKATLLHTKSCVKVQICLGQEKWIFKWGDWNAINQNRSREFYCI